MITLIAIFASACPVVGADDGAEPATVNVGAAAPGSVTATVVRGPNGFEVEGRVRVSASHAVVWAVLTDYDGIDRFVSSMSESRIIARGDDHVLVEQVAVGRVLFLKRRMRTTLRVHEDPPGRIEFEDILRKDFEHYRGEWRIEDHGPELAIVYRVQARPTASIPDFVARGLFERTVHQLLSELEKEIVKRSALAERRP